VRKMRFTAISGAIALAGGLIAGAITLAAPGAASGAVLAGTHTGAPSAAATARELSGVSCPAVKECVAVGFDQSANGGNGGPLAETWNGKTWKAVTLPLPAAGVSGELSGVSCPTTKECVAVGQYSGGLLAETWNGKAWAPKGLLRPKGAGGGFLQGVSCATAKSCVAVGIAGFTSFSEAVSETWNGSAWASAAVPVPPGSLDADLDGVSCTSAKSCIAVGAAGNSSSGLLADSWNGKAWKVLPVPTPAVAGTAPTFTGISCTSTANCVAVGSSSALNGPPGPLNGFAEQWNGKKWSGLKITWPKGTANSYLMGVSCAKAGNCVTAGGENINLRAVGHTGKAAAAFWNGKTWTAAKLPALRSGRTSLFNGVSCPSTTECVAVGQYGPVKTTSGAGWAGFWNGKSWKQAAAV
jgi:hypothetical protein